MFGRRVFEPAAGRFVVTQFGMGGPKDAEAGLSEAEAEIDIVECDREILFIESPKLEVEILFHQHASRRHRGKILDQMSPREVAMLVANPGMSVPRNAAGA